MNGCLATAAQVSILLLAPSPLTPVATPIETRIIADDDGAAAKKHKTRSAAEQRRARVDEIYHQLRYNGPGPAPDGIYGNDDRRDVYDVSDPFILGLAESICIVLSASELVDNGDDTYTLMANRWTEIGGVALCSDEPFNGQYQIGFCSGVLVGSNLVVTAGHCVDASDCGAGPVAFVFGFDQLGPQSDPLLVVSADNVYFCDAVIDHELGGELDHSVVRLDRTVVGRNPVSIRRDGEVTDGDPLVMIGHPVVLPKKIDDGGQVQDANVEAAFFLANVDGYGGGSGSPVFNLATGVVEGILVRGNPDWEFGACVRSNRCQNAGCPGWEEIGKTVSFAESVPVLGLLLQPIGNVVHIGEAGGPFEPTEVNYTLSNATPDPIDYEVSLQAGGGAPILINGDTISINGVLEPGGPDAVIAVTLASSVNVFPRGNYSAVIEFEDLTNNTTVTRRHAVEIGEAGFDVAPQDDFQSSGPEGGPFSDTMIYTITSNRPTQVRVRVVASDDWISIDGGIEEIIVQLSGVGDFAEVELGFSEQANALARGLNEGLVEFENLSGGGGDTSREVALDVGRFAYASSDTPIDINDNSEITSRIEVSDLYCIGDVDVEIDVTHSHISDLVIELESPMGTVVRLHNRNGGSGENIHVTYDDLTRPPAGPGLLRDFNAEVATGVWTLRVSDNADLDTGSLDSWSLKIAAGDPICPPVARDLELAFPSNLLDTILLDAVSPRGAPIDYIITSLPSSGSLHDPSGGEITTVPHILEAGGDSVMYDPPPDFAGLDAFTYKANDGMNSIAADVALTIGTRLRALFFDMEVAPEPAWEMEGEWSFGEPSGAGGANGGPDPSSGFTGENVFGYNLTGDYDNNMSEQHLTTSPLDFTGLSGVTLRFRRWLGVESSAYDRAYVRVSTNGVDWTTVWENQRELADTDWQRVELDIADIADDQPEVQIRWTLGATDASFVYCGWNIDDVEILALTPLSIGDVNCDGDVNALDIEPFLLALFDPAEYASRFGGCDINLADINGDGAINALDIEG
ncbi:MAG: proprotein convertase P-domain-containing protein, partial [Planctomycetes bacterium]|nr:proprotein convertase P-domain-containing protein [Planctomycetota bacterium]